jgi:hypothetical protein|nr:MAG TPA: hypothetical protein [Caudoviricetes sp.]
MNIFDRALILKRNNIKNITMLDRAFTSKDLFLNDIVLIDFAIGQEIYFFVFKSVDTKLKNNVLSSIDLQDVINENTKAISINLNTLKSNQFKSEQKIIYNFIRQVGELNVNKVSIAS